MRCLICDAEEHGLSNYRPDGRYHATKFTTMMGDVYCSECSSSIDEVTQEFYEDDEEFDDD